MVQQHKVADLSLAEAGRMRIEWAEARMPVLTALREKARAWLSGYFASLEKRASARD